jgi:hypothetical protein
MDEERLARLPDGFQDRCFVERREHAQVHDLGRHALGLEKRGGIRRVVHHPAVGDHRDVAPLPHDARPSQSRLRSGEPPRNSHAAL